MSGGQFFSRKRTDAPRAAAAERRSLRQTPLDRARRYMPRGSGTGLLAVFLAAIAFYGADRGGHMDDFRAAYGEPHDALARLLGLGIDEVHLSGLVELRESEVLAAAGVGPLRSLAFLDANEVRQRLESVPMIRQASVSKLYPDALSIAIVEREPQALWQRNGEVFVIAADGTVIDLMTDPRFSRLPFVAGEGANTRAQDYVDIVAAAGPLAERIRAGILVSGRRWDVKFDNDLIVRLPELDAVEAMKRLVEVEQRDKVLGKDLIAIDMRQGDRIAMRLSEEGAAAFAAARKTGKRRAPDT